MRLVMLDDDHDHSVAIDLAPDSAGRKRISIYQPETAGLIFPETPEFANFAEACPTSCTSAMCRGSG